ncbi:hypothetical protein FB451DRAFT_1273284 [Mycena latifolia]|nr:hypothetical protein FB451DRAFT_1273284 [Mycena latifolia]
MPQDILSSPGVTSFKPRRRVSLACVLCRKRKIKCSRSDESPYDPCQRCKRRGLVCEYVSVSEERAQSTSRLPAGTPAAPSVPLRPPPLAVPRTAPGWNLSHHSFDPFNYQMPAHFEYSPHPPSDRSYFTPSPLFEGSNQPSGQLHLHAPATSDDGAMPSQPPHAIRSASEASRTESRFRSPISPEVPSHGFSNLSMGSEHLKEHTGPLQLFQPGLRRGRHCNCHPGQCDCR